MLVWHSGSVWVPFWDFHVALLKGIFHGLLGDLKGAFFCDFLKISEEILKIIKKSRFGDPDIVKTYSKLKNKSQQTNSRVIWMDFEAKTRIS